MLLHRYSKSILGAGRRLPLIVAGFIAALAGASLAHADLGAVNLSMTATLVANSCEVSPDSKDKTVDMGIWATKQFASTPTLPPVRFTLNLENCGAGASNVAVTFNGTADTSDGTLLALNSGGGTASKVGIAILDKDRNRIPLGQPGPLMPLTPNAANVSLVFYSQYVATGGQVTAGAANADATFTLDYQ